MLQVFILVPVFKALLLFLLFLLLLLLLPFEQLAHVVVVENPFLKVPFSDEEGVAEEREEREGYQLEEEG